MDILTGATQWRDGHVWCLLHNTWWKLCSCPGQWSSAVPITKEVIEATTPKRMDYDDIIMRRQLP